MQAVPQQLSSQSTPRSAADGAASSVHAVELGQPIEKVDPVVPKKLRNFTGVVLHGTIAIDGTFVNLEAVSGEPPLTASALDAVRQWRYTPATTDGQPVAMPVWVSFQFYPKRATTNVEPDLPFPTKPNTPVEAQIGNGEILHAGQGVKPPKVTYSPDPEFSDAARAAKLQGIVVLSAVIGADGAQRDVWVVKKLGMGLDQKAIETVRRWKFDPATKDGKPVTSIINIEINFRSY